MVLDITNNKRVDMVLLERITNEVEKRLSTSNFVPPVTTDNKPNTDQSCIVDSGSEHQEQVSGLRSRESEQLLSLLGNVLQQ
ncbi:tetratricopeptide repeat protein 27-like, partial [Trifolium medium]|nr:tetratricopeptide repeat protein 27-like [Trifolium medium]